MEVKATEKQGGFTLVECLVVVTIVLIVAGLSLPTLSRAFDNARLKSATSAVAGFYQQTRMRAAQDDTYYEIIATPSGVTPAQICLDLNGNGICDPGEPQAAFNPQVALSNSAIPAQLSAAQLGFNPVTNTENSAMYDQLNQSVPGLAWNGRGLPCQRPAPTSACSGSIEWVQYVKFQRSANDTLYAAITVSPTGRIRVWTYNPAANGNGSWF